MRACVLLLECLVAVTAAAPTPDSALLPALLPALQPQSAPQLNSTQAIPHAPRCQVTPGHPPAVAALCMEGGRLFECTRAVDPWRGAVPSSTGAWALSDDYVYFKDRGLVSALASRLRGQRVIEFGSGKGCYVDALRRRGIHAIGYDGAPDVAQQTRGLVAHADLTTPLSVGCADYVMSFEVAEHIPRQFESTFLANLDAHNTKGVLLSWSPIPDGNGHVNVRAESHVRCHPHAHPHALTPSAVSPSPSYRCGRRWRASGTS